VVPPLSPMTKSRRHILLVEEHRDIRTAFVALFETVYHYSLHVATAARDATGISHRQDVDVAVIDLSSGTESHERLGMIRAWRYAGRMFPVIATGVLDSEDLIVATFEAGADDFVRKPYLFSEMRVRIQGQLARHLSPAIRKPRVDGVALPEKPFVFGGATITPDLRIRFPNGHVTRLLGKHVGILRMFSQHQGQLILRDDLIYEVWGADANTNSASVHQYLHMLRKLYRENGIDLSGFIMAESKVGWRLAAGHS
jgi:DNA-binding response OmpR family regulator